MALLTTRRMTRIRAAFWLAIFELIARHRAGRGRKKGRIRDVGNGTFGTQKVHKYGRHVRRALGPQPVLMFERHCSTDSPSSLARQGSRNGSQELGPPPNWRCLGRDRERGSVVLAVHLRKLGGTGPRAALKKMKTAWVRIRPPICAQTPLLAARRLRRRLPFRTPLRPILRTSDGVIRASLQEFCRFQCPTTR